MITPNHHEAESVTHMRIRSAADAREAARRFRERAKSDAVLITRGEHGMWLLGPMARMVTTSKSSCRPKPERSPT